MMRLRMRLPMTPRSSAGMAEKAASRNLGQLRSSAQREHMRKPTSEVSANSSHRLASAASFGLFVAWKVRPASVWIRLRMSVESPTAPVSPMSSTGTWPVGWYFLKLPGKPWRRS